MISCKNDVEVIESFSTIEESTSIKNQSLEESNLNLMTQIENKAMEQPEIYAGIYSQSLEFHDKTLTLKSQLKDVKDVIYHLIGDREETSKMSKNVNQVFFTNDTISNTGKKLMNAISNFKTTTGDQLFFYPKAEKMMLEQFTIEPVQNNKGENISYLEYHFKDQPAIATIARLTVIQNNSLETENQFLRELIENPEH